MPLVSFCKRSILLVRIVDSECYQKASWPGNITRTTRVLVLRWALRWCHLFNMWTLPPNIFTDNEATWGKNAVTLLMSFYKQDHHSAVILTRLENWSIFQNSLHFIVEYDLKTTCMGSAVKSSQIKDKKHENSLMTLPQNTDLKHSLWF